MWLVHVCGWYVVGIWLVCGEYVVGMWLVCGQYVVGMWSVKAGSMWLINQINLFTITVRCGSHIPFGTRCRTDWRAAWVAADPPWAAWISAMPSKPRWQWTDRRRAGWCRRHSRPPGLPPPVPLPRQTSDLFPWTPNSPQGHWNLVPYTGNKKNVNVTLVQCWPCFTWCKLNPAASWSFR